MSHQGSAAGPHGVVSALARAALGLALFAAVAWALRTASRRPRYVLARDTVPHAAFRAGVRDGDLLLTRASNNTMSRLHSYWLGTPIAHVGVAVVERTGSPTSRVYMFESGAPRGSQLRDLDGYVAEGADYVWWRPLVGVSDRVRERIRAAIERMSRAAYSWSFLADLPQELMSVAPPCALDLQAGGAAGATSDLGASSCGELVAQVYELAGLLAAPRRPSQRRHKRWLPMHFVDDRAGLPWSTGTSPLGPPRNVVFGTATQREAARRAAAIDALASAVLLSASVQ